MSANFDALGKLRQLDLRPEPEEQVTEEQASDPARVARLLMRMLRDLAQLKRRWWPHRIDFEDHVFDSSGTTKHRFAHGLMGRIRWWVVDCQDGLFPILHRHADTAEGTLVLVSFFEGTATIRIEEAG